MISSKLFYLFIVIFLSFSSIAEDQTVEDQKVQEMLKLRFDPDYTHEQTKSNFLKLLARDCKGFGYMNIAEDERTSAIAILETYPKEIALKYFKENYKDLCYYGFSLALNYLIPDYKNKLRDIVNTTVRNCLRSSTALTLCNEITKEFFYNDMSRHLNLLCDKESFESFKQLYCNYADIKRKSCDFYAGNSYINCPEYQAHMAELAALLKVYFNQNCRKFPQRKPNCK